MKLLPSLQPFWIVNFSEFPVETINITRPEMTWPLYKYTPIGSPEFSSYPTSSANSSCHRFLPPKWYRRTCKAMLTGV